MVTQRLVGDKIKVLVIQQAFKGPTNWSPGSVRSISNDLWLAYSSRDDGRIHPKERLLAGYLPGVIYDLHVRCDRDECPGWHNIGE